MGEDLQREQVIFEAAARLSADQREVFLGQACGADDDLRNRVEALLEALAPAGAPGGDTTVTAPQGGHGFALAPEEKAGDEIGPYKLKRKLGEGGMGAVWLAEQDQPVRRQVALKVVRADLDSVQVLTRFGAERQALALMDHPNIAKILEAGATSSRRPYFAMEFVDGVPITAYCDQHQLSIRERLELFVPVCEAVQHAHQKGIVHRDLKPGNVMVGRYDDKPVSKVIDFGVAKATGGQLTDRMRTQFTQAGAIVGTLEYMSPEQAELNQADIDTRSDVYSLGVMLYELLTGSTPLTRDSLRQRAFDEILRRIREEDPPKPSTRLSQSKERRAIISAQRKLAPAQLTKVLKGDLDWVVMKALEKDRSRRYETANGLARDLLRHLRDEPVAARPRTNIYRLRKMVRRHRIAFAALMLITFTLLSGLAISTRLFLREKKARVRATTATTFLAEMLNNLDPSVAQGDVASSLRQVLDQTAARIGKDLSSDPEMQADLRDVVGHVYYALGLYDQAETVQRAAIVARESASGSESPDMAAELNLLATTLYSKDELEEAEKLQRRALAMRRQIFGFEHTNVAESLDNLSMLLLNKGSLDEAETLQRQALAMSRRLSGDESPQVANSLNNLAAILVGRQKFAEAEKLQREELARSTRRLGTNSPDIAISLNNLALLLSDEGKLADSEEVTRQALIWRQRVLPKDHRDIAQSFDVLGRVLFDEHKDAEAEQNLREALERRRTLDTNSIDLAFSLEHVAQVLERQANYPEAEALLREAERIRSVKAPDDPWTFNTQSRLGGVLIEEKKFMEAETLLISGYEGVEKRQDKAPAGERVDLQKPLERLVHLYQANGQSDKAALWQKRLEELQAKQHPKRLTEKGQQAQAQTGGK